MLSARSGAPVHEAAALPADWLAPTPVDAAAFAPAAGAAGADERRQALVRVLERYGAMTFVPYVWGGRTIGSRTDCEACRACIVGKRKLAVERRLKACEPCNRCGMDCTHFANRAFREAGLDYPYASTRDLSRSSARKLRERYGLVDVGRDLARARPGDLILHPRHVVMLLRSHGDNRGDVVHVSRSIASGGRAGGIEIVRDQDLRRHRGPVLKILRHAQLFDGPLPEQREPAKRPRGKHRPRTKAKGQTIS